MSKHAHISFRDRLRYEQLIHAEAGRLIGQAQLLGNLDEEIVQLARGQFQHEGDFTRWIVEPSERLNGQTPLESLATEEGRAKVVEWLEQMADGGYM